MIKKVDDECLSQVICDNNITSLNMRLHIRKSLKNKLSETISELMVHGFSQQYLSHILELDQPKISGIKTKSMTLTDTRYIQYLRILGVYCVIDTGKNSLSDLIKFYSK